MDLSGSKSGSQVDYIRQIVDRQLADLHTAIPAIVESFDPATQMIECVPVIRARKKSVAGDEFTEDRPKLVKVPLITPYVRMLKFSLTMPILPGDTVMLMFQERGLDYWQETGEISDPPEDQGARMHDWTDGIAAVGPIALPDVILDYQIDSTELRNEFRTCSYQLWVDELEARVPNGSFIRQKASGDIDTESILNYNTKTGVDRNTDVGNNSNEVVAVDKNLSVGANVNRVIAANETSEISGTLSTAIVGESVEYGESGVKKNADGTYEIHSDVEVVIKAPIIRLCGETIVQGNLVVEDELTVSDMAFTPHVHEGVMVGSSSTSVPVSGPGAGPAPAACPAKPARPSVPAIPAIPAPERRGP